MFFENTQVFNFEGALRGMRNPLESWHNSDSAFGLTYVGDDKEFPVLDEWIQHDFPNGANPFEIDKYVADKLPWLDNNGYIRQDGEYIEYAFIGPKDMERAQALIKAGPEHAKFLRQILVSTDIVAPRYW